ncbi:MAG: MBL fold metallo-hydrolase [Candidatus Neomarinimicrobiota bacterium]
MAAVLLWSGCVTPRIQPHADQGALAHDHPDYNTTIQVQYLGNEGFFFRRGDYAVIAAPLYTNPHWLHVGLWSLRPDTVLIDWLHPRPPELQVDAILVGHAHYDHLLDVPYIARKHHPEARVYGSLTAANLTLASEPSLEGRVVALDDEVARGRRPGTWFYVADSTIRFMAVESAHGPQAAKVHIMKGKIESRLKRPPRTAWGWKEGETLAYIVDFMGPDQSIDFRIYFEDTTLPDSTGLPPVLPPADQHPYDLVVMCVAAAQALREYPTNLTTVVQPKHVMLGHWEDFFRSPVKPPKRLLITHIDRFIDEVLAASPDTQWLLPQPGAIYHYQPER